MPSDTSHRTFLPAFSPVLVPSSRYVHLIRVLVLQVKTGLMLHWSSINLSAKGGWRGNMPHRAQSLILGDAEKEWEILIPILYHDKCWKLNSDSSCQWLWVLLFSFSDFYSGYGKNSCQYRHLMIWAPSHVQEMLYRWHVTQEGDVYRWYVTQDDE